MPDFRGKNRYLHLKSDKLKHSIRAGFKLARILLSVGQGNSSKYPVIKVSSTQSYIVLAFLLIPFVWGCGYRSRSDLLGHINSVTVSPITNETVEYGLEDELADAIKQEFRRHWSEGTDSVFTCVIKTYELLTIGLDQNNQPEQYRLFTEMSFVFEDLKRNKVLRNEKHYEKIHDFYIVADRGEPPETLKEARQKLAEEAAEDIVSSIVEEW